MTQLYPNISIDNNVVCDICHYAKQKKLSFPTSHSIAKSNFELLHFDIWGPLSTTSIHGHKYFLTIVDDHSRFVWIILLKTKASVSLHVKNFITLVENQFHVTPKVVRSDNGPEFILNDFFASKGIIHQRSCVETPQQNGRVERKHQHILNVGRALLFQSKLPKHFWSYALLHATFLINRVSTPLLQNKSPYQVLHNHVPDLSQFKVFGSLCFASTLSCHRSKLDPRARKSIFLGFTPGMKGYVLYDLHFKNIFVSRHVTFHDHILPYTSNNTNPAHQWSYTSTNEQSTISPPIIIDPDTLPTSNSQPLPSSPSQSSIPSTDPITTPSSVDNPIRKSLRQKNAPSHLKDYVCNTFINSSSPSPNNPHSISHFVSYNNLSASQYRFSLSLTTQNEPKSFNEANKFECWRQAMHSELLALDRTGTWQIVDLPPNVTPIGCRWVYKVKLHADGTVERYKARLVAKGYNQIEGLDYFETYSPVAKVTSVRLIIALASINHWFLHQLDVNNAFLHGDLQEDVYMMIPPGVKTTKPNQVCKLTKSLYGLKQASRKWYEKLTSLLIQHHYVQAPSDHSLFIKKTNSSFTALLVYVDDVILAGNSLTEFQHIKSILHEAFQIKDLGVLKYFLGLEVSHSKQGISLCQRKYCLDLLSDSGLLGTKPANTPSDPSIKLHNDSSAPYHDIPSYRRLIGRLLYLNTTRPDITFMTQQLSQFLSKSTITHYQAAVRVLRYLKNNPGRGLFFPRDSTIHISGFSDADWAGCLDTRRSI
jgi:hypothetical protein